MPERRTKHQTPSETTQEMLINTQALGNTCEGLRDAFFLPLPGLIVLLRRPLVILRQSALA